MESEKVLARKDMERINAHLLYLSEYFAIWGECPPRTSIGQLFHFLKSIKINLGMGVLPNPKERVFFLKAFIKKNRF